MPVSVDDFLTGVIIVLVMFFVWRWMNGSSCGGQSFTLSCGCRGDVCRCRGSSHMSFPSQQLQQLHPAQTVEHFRGGREAFDTCGTPCKKNIVGTAGYGPTIPTLSGDYSGETIQEMSYGADVDNVKNSHQEYIEGLGFAGLPGSSSHDTVLEETGRSYGTSDFVGLTARKFCKARQLATPDMDARTVPTETVKEWCSIDMNELV